MVALVRPNPDTSRKASGGRLAADGFQSSDITNRSGRFDRSSLADRFDMVEAEAAVADRTELSGSGRPALRLVVDNSDDPRFGPEPLLSGRLPAVDRGALMVVISLAALVFGSLLVIRVAQGSPADGSVQPGGSVSQPVSADRTVAVSGPATVGQDVVTVTAKPGDSMWSIARSLDPNSDPRPAVAALIEANGSDSVSIGQQIVIPNELLD